MLRLGACGRNALVYHRALTFPSRKSALRFLQSHCLSATECRAIGSHRGEWMKINKRKTSSCEGKVQKNIAKESKDGKKDNPAPECKVKKEECKAAGGGVFEWDGSLTLRLEQRPHLTLRPEDATAAACAAKRAEAAARRAALAKRRPLPPRPDQQEPLARERLCQPVATEERSFWRPPPPQRVPLSERTLPQPTGRWVESADPEEDKVRRASHIAAAYRPTAVPIRVCTPQEVRELFPPPPPPPSTDCPCPGPSPLRRMITWLFLFTCKASITAFIIWVSIDLGIWEHSDRAADLVRFWTVGDESELPRTRNVVYQAKETWNAGVRNAFYFVGRFLPEFTKRAVDLSTPGSTEASTLDSMATT